MKNISLVLAHLFLLVLSLRALGQSAPVLESASPAAETRQQPAGPAPPSVNPDWVTGIEPLVTEWNETGAGSDEEREVADRIKARLAELAPAVHDALNTFWSSPGGSAEETAALDFIRSMVDDDTAQLLLRIYEQAPPASVSADDATPVRPSLLPYDLIGAQAALPVTTVDLVIKAPAVVEAGEQITIFGEIHNRGKDPIWIVDTRTQLTIPVNIWGMSVEFPTTLPAFISTTPLLADEALRIEGGSSHTISWLVDFAMIAKRQDEQRAEQRRQALIAENASRKEGDESKQDVANIAEPKQETEADGAADRLFRRTTDTFFGFLLFRPDRYEVVANMHVWAKPPVYNDSFQVINLGDSASIAASAVMEVTPPQTVLMFGAMVGGIICYILRLAQNGHAQLTKRMFAVELPSAMLLCVIGTIMLSRVGNTDFLISIKVQDFWGAIATGFIIQWLGLTWFMNRLKAGKQPEAPADAAPDAANTMPAPATP